MGPFIYTQEAWKFQLRDATVQFNCAGHCSPLTKLTDYIQMIIIKMTGHYKW